VVRKPAAAQRTTHSEQQTAAHAVGTAGGRQAFSDGAGSRPTRSQQLGTHSLPAGSHGGSGLAPHDAAGQPSCQRHKRACRGDEAGHSPASACSQRQQQAMMLAQLAPAARVTLGDAHPSRLGGEPPGSVATCSAMLRCCPPCLPGWHPLARRFRPAWQPAQRWLPAARLLLPPLAHQPAALAQHPPRSLLLPRAQQLYHAGRPPPPRLPLAATRAASRPGLRPEAPGRKRGPALQCTEAPCRQPRPPPPLIGCPGPKTAAAASNAEMHVRAHLTYSRAARQWAPTWRSTARASSGSAAAAAGAARRRPVSPPAVTACGSFAADIHAL
jgi:hypothetical protein